MFIYGFIDPLVGSLGLFMLTKKKKVINHLFLSLSANRGKGDYHRLGHGTDDHVRRPRKVAALQGKKVICVATGSLHCVACTDNGKL